MKGFFYGVSQQYTGFRAIPIFSNREIAGNLPVPVGTFSVGNSGNTSLPFGIEIFIIMLVEMMQACDRWPAFHEPSVNLTVHTRRFSLFFPAFRQRHHPDQSLGVQLRGTNFPQDFLNNAGSEECQIDCPVHIGAANAFLSGDGFIA